MAAASWMSLRSALASSRFASSMKARRFGRPVSSSVLASSSTLPRRRLSSVSSVSTARQPEPSIAVASTR